MASHSTEDFFQACGAPAPLVLELRHGKSDPERLDLSFPFARIGRSVLNDIRVDHWQISFRHTYLQMLDGRPFYVDLDSRTGTVLNDVRTAHGWLQPDTAIEIGPLTVQVPAGQAEHRSFELRNYSPLSTNQPSDDRFPSVAIEFKTGMEQPSWHMNRQLVLVGQTACCKLKFIASGVSRQHCALVLTEQGLWVVDLCSRAGTFVNGEQVANYALIKGGDSLQVGKIESVVHFETVESILAPATMVPSGSETPDPTATPEALEVGKPEQSAAQSEQERAGLAEQKEVLERERTALQEEQTRLDERIEALAQREDELSKHRLALDATEQSLERERRAIEVVREKIEKELFELESNRSLLEQQRDQLQSERQGLAAEQEQLAELRGKIQFDGEQLEIAQRQHNQAVAEFDQERTALEAREAELAQMTSQAKSELGQLADQKAQMLTEIQQQREQLRVRQAELDQQHTACQALKETVDREREKLKEEQAEWEKQRTRWNAERAASVAELEQKRQEFDRQVASSQHQNQKRLPQHGQADDLADGPQEPMTDETAGPSLASLEGPISVSNDIDQRLDELRRAYRGGK